MRPEVGFGPREDDGAARLAALPMPSASFFLLPHVSVL